MLLYSLPSKPKYKKCVRPVIIIIFSKIFKWCTSLTNNFYLPLSHLKKVFFAILLFLFGMYERYRIAPLIYHVKIKQNATVKDAANEERSCICTSAESDMASAKKNRTPTRLCASPKITQRGLSKHFKQNVPSQT